MSSLQGAFEMPILPLHNITSLLPTILAFQRQLWSARSTRPLANPVMALLPYCSNNPPIPDRATNVLSELCLSLPELSQYATSMDGQQKLRDTLPDCAVAGDTVNQTAEEVIEFWQAEMIWE